MAIDIDHRVTKQQHTPYSRSMGLRVVERPVVWHANKKTTKKTPSAMQVSNTILTLRVKNHYKLFASQCYKQIIS